VGAEYLRGASNQLRAEAQPLMQALTKANSQRAEDELGAQHPYLMVLPGLAALAVLWWVNGNLARVFRRRLNIGVMSAFIAIAVLTAVGAGVSSSQDDANSELRDGSYRVAVAEAEARTAANDAKSNESRRLGAQGSGAVFEEGWQQAALTVEENASPATLDLWQAHGRPRHVRPGFAGRGDHRRGGHHRRAPVGQHHLPGARGPHVAPRARRRRPLRLGDIPAS
jgi:hypothetical protein